MLRHLQHTELKSLLITSKRESGGENFITNIIPLFAMDLLLDYLGTPPYSSKTWIKVETRFTSRILSCLSLAGILFAKRFRVKAVADVGLQLKICLLHYQFG